MFDDYIKTDSSPLYKTRTSTDNEIVCHLLWGDGVKFDANDTSTGNGRRKVSARGGKEGFVDIADLGGQSLLEYYFIDVGQGDGVLIKTPDFRHIVIDGGFKRSQQDTGKNAADFVDWKFFKDYGMSVIEIDAMLVSHCDADHYGGLESLLDVAQIDELDASSVSVEAFYHAGLSWWRNAADTDKTLGTHTSVNGESFWTQLLDDRSHAESVVGAAAGQKLHGWWHDFIETVVGAETKAGDPTPIRRLSDKAALLPGFDGSVAGEPIVHVLGPIEKTVNGLPALRRFGSSEAQNTNGVSLLLRVDYGRTRVLLTGDLNKASQEMLLEDLISRRTELLCDVAKSCHHGSDDVSYRFLQAMRPAATVISSGDNEGHDHPRPSILAASATTGYLEFQNGGEDLLTPLVYSTELARSIDLGNPTEVEIIGPDDQTVESRLKGAALQRSRMKIERAKRKSVRFRNAKVVGGLVYGLINVRTDGDKILCATLDERGDDWRIKSFRSRF